MSALTYTAREDVQHVGTALAQRVSDIVDHGHDWTEWLSGAVVTSFEVIHQPGITVTKRPQQGAITPYRLTGGTKDHVYWVDTKITDSDGEVRTKRRLHPIREPDQTGAVTAP